MTQPWFLPPYFQECATGIPTEFFSVSSYYSLTDYCTLSLVLLVLWSRNRIHRPVQVRTVPEVRRHSRFIVVRGTWSLLLKIVSGVYCRNCARHFDHSCFNLYTGSVPLGRDLDLSLESLHRTGDKQQTACLEQLR